MSESTLSAYPSTRSQKTSLAKKLLVMVPMITIIGGILTGVMTYMNIGFSDAFFYRWLTSFIFATLVMAPSGSLVMFLVNKIVKRLFQGLSETRQNLIFGVLMAFIMESLMALVTTINNIGLADLTQFLSAWMSALLMAIPVGLVLAVTMSLLIKPKIERFLAS